ncbi:MAG: hypothetical protein JOZ81_05560, partial [Chloroflexi bacterium]|nr:hypothetical protein [Chloroflexota bacterium]
SQAAYDRLIENARLRGDALVLRRIVERYEKAAAQFGLLPSRYSREHRA